MNDGAKPHDLEDRTFEFAQSVRAFVRQLPRTVSNTEDVKQLVRASGSVAANWIEADEALSKKDFLMRVKICRKEAKESRLFLRLVDAGLAKSNVVARETLTTEARELTLIFSSIISRAGAHCRVIAEAANTSTAIHPSGQTSTAIIIHTSTRPSAANSGASRTRHFSASRTRRPSSSRARSWHFSQRARWAEFFFLMMAQPASRSL